MLSVGDGTTLRFGEATTARVGAESSSLIFPPIGACIGLMVMSYKSATFSARKVTPNGSPTPLNSLPRAGFHTKTGIVHVVQRFIFPSAETALMSHLQVLNSFHGKNAHSDRSQTTPARTRATRGRTPPRNRGPNYLRKSFPAGKQAWASPNSQETNHFSGRTQENRGGAESTLGKGQGCQEIGAPIFRL
jgi:hypothetical protein